MATKAEQLMWDYLSGVMRGRWDAQRHEDKYSDSIPDVSFARGGVDGWLELKIIPAWPKKANTPINLSHLRPGQVNWLEDRGRAGNGACYLLLAVGPTPSKAEWLLVHWSVVREVYDRTITHEQLYAKATDWCLAAGLHEMMVTVIANVRTHNRNT